MKPLNKLIYITVLLLFVTQGKAQKFSAIQLQSLKQEAIKIAESYNEMLQLIAQKDRPDIEKDSLIKSWYKDEKIMLFNNISPERSSVFLSVAEYIDVIKTEYPAGIIFKAELIDTVNVKPGLLVKAGSRLYVEVPVQISVTGIYKGKQIIKNKKNIYFLYRFAKNGKTALSDFKFEKILLNRELFPLEKYNYSSIEFLYSVEYYLNNSENRNEYDGLSPYEPELSPYVVNSALGRQFGVNYFRSLSRSIGVNIGLTFQKIPVDIEWFVEQTKSQVYFQSGETNISTKSPVEYVNYDPYRYPNYKPKFYQDKDKDTLLPFVHSTGSKDSRLVKTMSIPISIEWKYEKPGKLEAYFQGGIQMVFKRSTDISAKGVFETQGYYPTYNFTLHDLSDYGYSTRKIDTSYTVKSKNLSIDPFAGIGAKFYFSKNIALNLSVYVAYPLQKDMLSEYNNKEKMYQYAPEYSVGQFMNDQFKNPIKNEKSWSAFKYEDMVIFGANVGLVYKF